MKSIAACFTLVALSSISVCLAEPTPVDAKPVCAGKDGYFFLSAELRQLSAGEFWGDNAAKVSMAKKPEWADPLPAILDFNSQLKELGIDLVMVPVPLKAARCADKLPDDVRATLPADIANVPAQQAFFKVLGDAGIKVIDLSQKLGAAEYCLTDSHWTPKACEIAADAIAAAIGDSPWVAENAKDGLFTASDTELKITGDLAKMADEATTVAETLPMRKIEGAVESKDSPLLLLGDSHCLVFHVGGDLFATGGGLADQLAFTLKMPIDVLGVRGSGATPARQNLFMRTKAGPEYLAGKKLVVWCFASREFTQSQQGWRPLPIQPTKK